MSITKRFVSGGAVLVYLAAAIVAGAQTLTTTTPRGEVRRAEVQELRAKIENAKKEAQSKIQSMRAEFQTKLKQIKDEKKKQVADNLFARLGMLNDTWVTRFTNALDKYDATLKKIQSRRDKVQAAGRDVTSVNLAIQATSAAIAVARTAVEAQAKKTYPVTVTTDAKLRVAFQTAHTSVKKDLMSVRDGVMRAAREAMQKAIQALRGVSGVDEDKPASSHPTSTNASSSE